MAITNRIQIGELAQGAAAFAMRIGDDTVVQVRPDLPEWEKGAAADQLFRVVRSTPATYATAALRDDELHQLRSAPRSITAPRLSVLKVSALTVPAPRLSGEFVGAGDWRGQPATNAS